MRVRACALVLAAAVGTAALPTAASASQLLDRNARGVKLEVDRSGRAMVSYRSRGRQWHVLAWGAVNAVAPRASGRQVALRLDYSGGWGSTRKNLWKTFKNSCGPYTGPSLPWLVTACTARDGSHWALQSWQRMLPNYGVAPNAKQAAWELRLSHWSGDLPVLTVNTNWAYRKFDHIFGRYSYAGAPVHGFKSTSVGNPLDAFGRNLYVDTFNSAYGPGWKRENSFLMHKGTGAFCYGFYPHGSHPTGKGERYRATIIGPGVTPDVMWQGKPLGAYDPSVDRQLAERQREVYASDTLCKPV
jgi:hypothetical protein